MKMIKIFTKAGNMRVGEDKSILGVLQVFGELFIVVGKQTTGKTVVQDFPHHNANSVSTVGFLDKHVAHAMSLLANFAEKCSVGNVGR